MVTAAVDEITRASSRRFWLAMSGFVVAFGLAPFSYKVEHRLETAVHISGGEAEVVDHELTERFQSPYAHRLVVVIQGLPDADSPGGARRADCCRLKRARAGTGGADPRIESADWRDGARATCEVS